MKRVDLDPAWLAAQYLEHRMPVRELAALAGVSERTVRNKLRAAGIGRRPPRLRVVEPSPPSRYPMLNDADVLRRRMVAGATLLGLSREIGCDRQAVRSALRRHGISWGEACISSGR